MNYPNDSTTVPVGSTDLNQRPTTSLTGKGDVRQLQLPNLQCSEDKFTMLQIATYKVRTLSDESHLIELEKEIENIKWIIIGISEMRRPGEKITELGDKHILYNDRKYGGVGFLIHMKFSGNTECFLSTSDRVVSVTIRISRRYKPKIIQVCAPTSLSSQEELDNLHTSTQPCKTT